MDSGLGNRVSEFILFECEDLCVEEWEIRVGTDLALDLSFFLWCIPEGGIFAGGGHLQPTPLFLVSSCSFSFSFEGARIVGDFKASA